MRVLVIGTGLVGSSLGLALVGAGHEVFLEDLNPSHARVAAGLGGGEVYAGEDGIEVVVVATPPASVAEVVRHSLIRFPEAVVTDVGSVKSSIIEAVGLTCEHAERYVPSHPMAGSQFTGPLTATARLFEDRTWAITAQAGNTPQAVAAVRELACSVGARVIELSPELHDEAVAQVSHVPHLMSILTASHLRGVPGENLRLAGQGIRDVTRIAGSDPALWRQIITTNATAIRKELQEVAADLQYLIGVLDQAEPLEAFLRLGQHGAQALRGKHGQEPLDLAVVTVEIPDEPRALTRLFNDVGDFGFNVEDFELTHDAVREVGYLSISVERPRAQQFREDLEERGWRAWLDRKGI
ncbi:prephenate dehydrogenase [Arachnia propionica]|uniref:Prephenate dehydrogenase n=1 Tax=Arachnia propionica TaxID=1750 RepID=A0A3P1TF54_9ACTN|nr:prephenate dehydrogenase [Arachnia propionica]RRD07173.1 prephenate dehydrogenase [Arachnia propionica]